MKKLLLTALLLGLAWSARSQQLVSALITVTNPAVTGDSITVNSVLRNWTNAQTATTLLTNLVSINHTKTNLYNQIALNRFSGVLISTTNTNSIVLSSSTLSVTIGGTWATVLLSTNLGTNRYSPILPFDVLPASVRTNQAADIVYGLMYSSNTVGETVNAFSNYVSRGATQTLGNKTMTNSLVSGSLLSNVTVVGYAVGLTNGWLTTSKLTNSDVHSLTFPPHGSQSNGGFMVFYGPSTNASSWIAANSNGLPALWGEGTFQEGALVDISTANEAALLNVGSALAQLPVLDPLPAYSRLSNVVTIVNYFTSGTNIFTTHLRVLAGLRVDAGVLTNVSLALVHGTFTNFTAHAGNTTNLAAHATTLNDSTFTGTNNWNGDLAFTRRANSSPVNGDNAGVILGTNVVISITGPTTMAAYCGFAAERGDSWHRVRFSGAVTNIIRNQSGVEPTAANRIITGTGADLSLTNEPSWVEVQYNLSSSRWEVMSHSH